ncbi:MAG TPA: protease pro-enzyme activation domain-containing protein [Terracidiphilus sp.]
MRLSDLFSGDRFVPTGPAASRLASPTFLLLVIAFTSQSAGAQVPDRLTQPVDPADVQVMRNHLPGWASPTNQVGLVPGNQALDHLTILLSRSQQQQAAFDEFVQEQQNPASPNYHHWLTPAEIGDRFGLSQNDIEAVTAWLQSQGLHVNRVSSSRIFIDFGGTVADASRAFQVEMHYYKTGNVQRFSASTNPTIPRALAPAIKGIRGLYTETLKSLSQGHLESLVRPGVTTGPSTHYLGPADFNTIYDVPSGFTGAGVTVGIVDDARTDFADFDNFRQLTATAFPNPIEIIPTAFGGTDPGPALTSPGGSTNGSQLESTLDVARVGSVAPGAQILLVVSGTGIWPAMEYLVETNPVPAQVMSVSWGGCEYDSPSGPLIADPLFQQAAAEGISTFVASGDSGASGCDSYFGTPPSNPAPNSPNWLCSSSYVTCVGGTQFNDTANPSLYWNSTNGTGFSSALGYIPEGAWNEPLNSQSSPQAASSGGGVSSVIPTPAWQTGTGVPAARSGRYTPDIAFSAAGHDGYFLCSAFAGASCVANQGGQFFFEYAYGTSAAAPGMAGIAALLDQKLGHAQGNLNPELYRLSAAVPAAFHDATVASSGVTNCKVNTPSICNNSIPGPTGLTGGQPGYLLTSGYDEVTGLGSLDVQTFLNHYAALPTPTMTMNCTPNPAAYQQVATCTATVSGDHGGTIFLAVNGIPRASGSPDASGKFSASGAVPVSSGSFTVNAEYTGDSNYAEAGASVVITAKRATPTFTFNCTPNPVHYQQTATCSATVGGDHGGTISFAVNGTTLITGSPDSNGTFSASRAIQVSSGSFTVTANYSGDTNYAPASASITVTAQP